MEPLKLPAGSPVAGYIRVSRIGGRSGEGFISPDVQREEIDKYAAHLKFEVPDDAWFDDQDYSGKNLDRPGWEELVARIESGELRGVIVYRTDRFARSVPDGATEIRRLTVELKAYFGSATEQMDVSTPQGMYMVNQFLNNAELQLNTLRSEWKRSKQRAIERGAHIGPTPLGYDRIPKGEKRAGCLVPDKAWRPIIRALFKRAADTGDGNRLLAKWANAKKPRPDGKQWTATTVGHVLANRVYVGEVSYRPRKEGAFEPLVNAEAHEPIVDEATWQAAQREPGIQKTNSGPTNLLSGLVRCAGCRYRMSASRGGKNIRVYRCTGQHGAGTCPSPAVITAEKIEPWVLDQVKSQWKTRIELAASERSSDTDLSEAMDRLEEARKELSDFSVDVKVREILGNERYYAAMEARVEEVDKAEKEVEALGGGRQSLPPTRIDWESLTREELREVLGGAIDAVFVRQGRGLPVEKRAVIVWAGELDDDVPTRGRTPIALRAFAWPEDD